MQIRSVFDPSFRVYGQVLSGYDLHTPQITPRNDEDLLLFARNKWLLAHAESPEAAAGAPVRLFGENIDIAPPLK